MIFVPDLSATIHRQVSDIDDLEELDESGKKKISAGKVWVVAVNKRLRALYWLLEEKLLQKNDKLFLVRVGDPDHPKTRRAFHKAKELCAGVKKELELSVSCISKYADNVSVHALLRTEAKVLAADYLIYARPSNFSIYSLIFGCGDDAFSDLNCTIISVSGKTENTKA